MFDKDEVDLCLDRFTTKAFYFFSVFLIKSLQLSTKGYFIVEEIIYKIKNKYALKKINVGEIWREYEDIYLGTYNDWIILNLDDDKEIITISSIKNHSDFVVKEVEPRIIYEFWLKK